MSALVLLQLAAAGCNVYSLGWKMCQNAIYYTMLGSRERMHLHREVTDEVIALELAKDTSLHFGWTAWERA